MQPLITAFSYTDDIVQVKTIIGEVAEVLSGEDMQRPESAEKLPADNAIQLKDVRFAYHDKEVLHGINLHIAPGTVNALVGPSGSGKSTIARLIASLWDVKDGAIALAAWTPGHFRWRSAQSASPMYPRTTTSLTFLSWTISAWAERVRPMRRSLTPRRNAAATSFIMGLENGYQTVCGASGGHLSGGERQRISIARAVLKDAPIVILDEATSYTDPENEAVIQSALARLVRGKTLLVIAPPAVHHCGRRSDRCCQSRQDRSDRHAGGAACFLPALIKPCGKPTSASKTMGRWRNAPDTEKIL